MARTRDSPRKNSGHATKRVTSSIPPTTTRKEAEKAAPKNKRSREDDSATAVESEEAAPAKKVKTTVSKSKRQHEADDTTAAESDQVVTKKARTTPGHTDLDAKLPEPQAAARRSSRAQTKTPVAPQRRKRRTPAEIAADKARVEEEKRQQEKLTADNHRAMQQMDIDEDVDRAETAARTIRTFADIEDDSEEEFVGFEDVSSDSDDPAEDALALKEANKALQKQIKALKAKADGGKKKGTGGKKTSQKVTFATGLRSDWNSGHDAADAIKEPVKKQTHVQISAGGLDNSDAEAVNPYPSSKSCTTLTEEELTEGAQKAKRNFSRRNELVSIVDEAEENIVPPQAAKKVTAKIPRPVQVVAGRRNKEPVLVESEKHRKGSAPVKVEKRNDSLPAKTAVAGKTKPKPFNGNNVRMSDLPEFAAEKWRDTFLPTLYDKFFASDEPFDGFYKGSDQFIALLQTIIEEVYPDTKYDVTPSDSIHFLAYNRVNEKRSSIGSNAIAAVKQHLSTLNGEKAAKDWLIWALRVDGPLFFEVPSPIGSPIDQKDPKYEFPRGRLLSHFVISLATPFLGLKAGSASENGYPKGLVALIMAALERAVRYLSKPSIRAKDFSKEFWGSKVGMYYEGFHGENGVSDARWKELVDACLGHSEDDTRDADLSILDHGRALVFNFCSPAKSRA